MKSSDNINPNIKVLDSGHKNEIIQMCEPYKNSDTEFGKQLAQTFSDYDWEGNHQFLGFYDEKKLVGIVSYHFCVKADLACLCDIFVIPEYRKKGVGKALLLETLSKYPNKRWLYQASIYNTPSQELALSVGFIKNGALLVFDL